MKVIHLNYIDFFGGGARAAYRIHQSLIKEGINSRMWVNKALLDDETIEGPSTKIEKVLVQLRTHLIRALFIKLFKTNNKSMHSPSVLPSNWVKRINDSDADIINLHWIQNEMLSIKDISKITKPIVWTIHDMWLFCGAEHISNDNRWREGYNLNNRPSYETGFDLNRWTWNRKKKYWKNPIQIVSTSRWSEKCIKESKLISNWPVSLIPNTLNCEVFKPTDRKVAREQLNLPSDKILILYGAFTNENNPYKGLDLLVSALEHLKNDLKSKKVELVIFGQGKPKFPPNFGLPIHYMGHFNDDISLAILYNAVNIVTVPSRNETFGQIACEAQACGTPVVAFNIGGLADIVEHQKTGYLANAFDIKDFANGITFVLDHIETGQIKKNARERAINKYSEKKIANQYLKLYKTLLI